MPTHMALTSGLPAYDGEKRDLAADGRDAEAVAVAADAGDDAVEQVPVARCDSGCRVRLQRAEAQRIEQGDRPRAHREDVAHDAADAGRRALVRLDRRRVVVRFDLEDDAAARRRCRRRRRSPRRALVSTRWPVGGEQSCSSGRLFL